MLQRQFRLSNTKDFDLIYRSGIKHRGKFGMLIALKPSRAKNNQSEGDGHREMPPQFGFVVSKKVGNAVVRHKLTRWLREITTSYVREFPEFALGFKFSYVAFEMPATFSDLESEYRSLLKRAGKVYESDTK